MRAMPFREFEFLREVADYITLAVTRLLLIGWTPAQVADTLRGVDWTEDEILLRAERARQIAATLAANCPSGSAKECSRRFKLAVENCQQGGGKLGSAVWLYVHGMPAEAVALTLGESFPPHAIAKVRAELERIIATHV